MSRRCRDGSLPSGGTDCSAPLRELNRNKAKGDLVIFVSDNESWIDKSRRYNPGTGVLAQWEEYRRRNPHAKLVCIDLQPGATTQASVTWFSRARSASARNAARCPAGYGLATRPEGSQTRAAMPIS